MVSSDALSVTVDGIGIDLARVDERWDIGLDDCPGGVKWKYLINVWDKRRALKDLRESS